MQIGSFIKDLFAGFQLLNLKNDVLRKRSDGMKYSVSLFQIVRCCDIVLTMNRSKRLRTLSMIFRCAI